MLLCIESYDFLKRKKNPAGLHHTEVRIGDAPEPLFSMEANRQFTKQNANQPKINHRFSDYFRVCFLGQTWCHWPTHRLLTDSWTDRFVLFRNASKCLLDSCISTPCGEGDTETDAESTQQNHSGPEFTSHSTHSSTKDPVTQSGPKNAEGFFLIRKKYRRIWCSLWR